MNILDLYKPAQFTSEVHVTLKYLAAAIAEDEVNMSPSYQRGHKWTRDQQEAFVGHLITGGETLPLIIQRSVSAVVAEILDGKQRLTALLLWLKGDIAAKCGARMILASELTALHSVHVKIRYIDLPWEERKAFYVKFNAAGTPHTAEEIAAALAAEE